MRHSDHITLKNGQNLRLDLCPALGGAIGGLWLQEHPVLRPTPDHATSSRETASFPMIPYSGRLGWCQFDFGGVAYHTRPNFEDSPHSLHGVGWLREWQMLPAPNPHHAIMHYSHAPDADWPFAFTARQEFILSDVGLHVKLTIQSQEAKRSQPIGLGFHPYFHRDPTSHIKAHIQQKWETDATLLLTHATPHPPLDGAVDAMNYDHCFTGWEKEAVITGGNYRLRLASDLAYLVVYTPPGKDYFCVEPASHRSNGVNDPHPTAQGVRILPPGGEMSGFMRLDFTE